MWTLTNALGLDLDSEEVVAFVESVWLGVRTQDDDTLNGSSIRGTSFRHAVRIARALDDMIDAGELRMPAHIIRAEKRRLGSISNAVNKSLAFADADKRISDLVKQEQALNGKHGALARVARVKGMSASNVGRRLKSHIAREKEMEQESMRSELRRKIQSRRIPIRNQ